jgi:hypothetical protein
MSDIGCDAVAANAPELALGLVDGQDRAVLLDHVRACPHCQVLVADLAETGDLLTMLAPEAEPPVGFGERVVDAITAPRRRARRRRAVALGITAAAAAILAVVVVRVVDARRDDVSAVAPALRTAPVVDAAGLKVGSVAISGTAPVAVGVTVDYAIPDGGYTLVIRNAHGSDDVLGSIDVIDGTGTWKGEVELPTGTPVRFAMVDEAGTQVCGAVVTELQA